MKEFEELKMSFNGTRPQRTRLSLPQELRIDDDQSRKIEEGQILVTANDLREMFDPHVNRTLELIDGQIAAIMANGGEVKVCAVLWDRKYCPDNVPGAVRFARRRVW